jgi:hypothetical protein
VNCWLLPRTMLAVAGVTANEVSTGGITVRLEDPEIKPDVAMTIATPGLMPVATPVLVTLAMAGALEVHVTELVMVCLLPSLNVPVATNACVAPGRTEVEAGATAIDDKTGDPPVPLSDTVCGLLFAESLKVNVPDRAPAALGVNVTDTAQLAPAARVAGHAFTVKSLRLLLTELMVNEED